LEDGTVLGGKIEKGETIEQGAMRELYEEVRIKNGQLSQVGILSFSFQNNNDVLQVHVFKLLDFSDNLIETEEMRPQWFFFDEIPFSEMWPDDEYWFPLFLGGKFFKGEFFFDRPSDLNYSSKIISHKLEEVLSLKDPY
jgi:8-oxo-dGTP pyrophosphatase MutT (NUDIX family)